jgi:hypothetical protein
MGLRSPACCLIAFLGVAVVIQQSGRAEQAPGSPQPGQVAGQGRGQAPGQTPGQPTRDTSAQQRPTVNNAPTGSGRISGRVVAADTGRPLRAARVSISGQQMSRSIVTEDSGVFDFNGLPEGRYTLQAGKTGFVTLSYGQRRPLQPGTPLQLADGQRLENIEMRVPRGGAITGHVTDETGEPIPNLNVRVMRYQYQQGERRLMPAGNGQTDDRGEYRVWGLNPGDYYVSAVMPNFGGVINQLGGVPAGRGGRGGPGPAPVPPVPGAPQTPDQQGPGRGGRGGRGAIGAIAAPAAAAAVAGIDFSQLADLQLDPGFADTLGVRLANVTANLSNIVLNINGQSLSVEQLGMLQDPNAANPIAYAPTYYPGVASPAEARAISVPLGGEAVGIDFSLLMVQTASVTGRLANPDGSAATAATVNLFRDQPGGRAGGPGENFGGRVQNDGSFAIRNVPPGRYVIRGRGTVGGAANGGRGGGGRGGRGGPNGGPNGPLPQLFATQSVTLGSGDTADVLLTLAPGATIRGSVTLPAGAAAAAGSAAAAARTGGAANPGQARFMAQATDSSLGTNLNAQVQPDGTFSLENVPAGTHWLRAQAPRGLALESISVGGRDVTDEPFEVRSGEQVDGVSVVFTDRISEVNGTITNVQGATVTDYTVLAFPEDSRLWRPQARQIMTTRPDQNGKYQLRGLPAGRYYITTIDPELPGQWFEPEFLEQSRTGAASLSIGAGETKTQDFRVR